MSKSKRSIIPYLFVALVGGFMVADFFFMGLAKSTFNGVATENAYQKGVNFNKLNQIRVYQDKTGWKGNISYSNYNKQLVFKLSDKEDKPITNAVVKAKVIRPITDKYDQQLEMIGEGEGVYKASANFLLKGQWEIKVKAQVGEQEFVTAKRIMVQ